MARQILPIAGQVIGGMVGGPWGAMIGGMLGTAVGNYVDPLRHQGPKLGEARTQTAQEGVYRPIVLGTGCVAGNVIHRSPRVVRVNRESVGKGSRDTVDTERGYRTYAIRIAEGPLAGLLRIWENETLVYDVRPESEIPAESVEYAKKFRFYNGDEEQLPDPALEAYMGVGNVSSYRGTAYIVFEDMDLTDLHDMVPQYRFEVASETIGSVGGTMAIGHSGQGRATSSSADGTEWSNAIPGPQSVSYASTVNNRIVVWSSTSSYWTDDHINWNGPFGSFGSIGGDHQSYCRSGPLIIPGGLGNGVFTTNDGENYSHVPGLTSNNIASRIGMAVSVSGYALGCKVSYSNGASWDDGGEPTGYFAGVNRVMSCNDAIFVLGCADSLFDPQPHVSRTINGLSWSGVTLGSSSGTRISYLCPGGGSDWVALTNNGEAWYSRDDCASFQYSGFTLPTIPSGLVFNGARFIASCGPSGNAWIYTSNDRGASWQSRANPLVQINILVTQGGRIPPMAGGKIPLSNIVAFSHLRVGSGLESYDVTSLTDLVDGVVFADGYSARDAITSILPIYNADAVECDMGSGYRINYVKRGGPVVRTLTFDDLVDEPEETVREDHYERPRKMHMAFQNPIIGYSAAKATSERISPDVQVVGEVSYSVPVTFSDVDEAWQRNDVQMRIAWTEAEGKRELSITDDQLDIVPADTLGVSLRGRVQRLRVLKVEYADGVMKLETIADRQSNYTSNVTGIPLPEPEAPPPSIVGPTDFAVMDIPALSDNHDRLLYYVAACGMTEAWQGAAVQRQDAGEFATIATFTRTSRTVMGVLEAEVTAASPHYTDTTNQVLVKLHMEADELNSLTQQQFLSEGGAFALETASGWEVLQYRDAEQVDERTYRLSHLARGRLNTGADAHAIGSKFVLLDRVQAVNATTAMIGQELVHRAVSVGRSPEGAPTTTITYQGLSQTEFPVAHLFGEIDGSTLNLSAVPRHRFGTEDHPVQSLNHDGYAWTATDGANASAAGTSGPAHSFDVSGWSTPITVTVAQNNRFTGTGPTVTEVIQ